MWANSRTHHPCYSASFDFMDMIRNSLSYTQLPQSDGDVMEEFRRNGREVPIDDSPMQWESNFNLLYAHSRHIETQYCLQKDCSPSIYAKKGIWCAFCRNNGESDKIFRSHQLKDNYGKTVCPILQKYVCPLCKATGPEAHTVKYCPKNPNPLPVALMNVLKAQRSETSKARVKRNRY
ncbi:nanos homolog 2 [Schistocerca serialis cubense]|uniref:nanos homolog 2 n=1 Tax=Schistocerca serialis cubense TaxID=2023355 RepID=UPI00214DF423|nr:nanos homolog 2 [Schistocerca serialis cubense]